jgi:hypothetical protein
MPVESRQSAEEQFAGGVLCRQVLRLRTLCSHFVLSTLRGYGKLKTVRDESGRFETEKTELPFVRPLRSERGSSIIEALSTADSPFPIN